MQISLLPAAIFTLIEALELRGSGAAEGNYDVAAGTHDVGSSPHTQQTHMPRAAKRKTETLTANHPTPRTNYADTHSKLRQTSH